MSVEFGVWSYVPLPCFKEYNVNRLYRFPNSEPNASGSELKRKKEP